MNYDDYTIPKKIRELKSPKTNYKGAYELYHTKENKGTKICSKLM